MNTNNKMQNSDNMILLLAAIEKEYEITKMNKIIRTDFTEKSQDYEILKVKKNKIRNFLKSNYGNNTDKAVRKKKKSDF